LQANADGVMSMRRRIIIASAAAVLMLQVTPHAAWAQQANLDHFAQLEEAGSDAYGQLWRAKERCDVAGWVAARSRMLAVIAGMRDAAKTAKKAAKMLGKFANDPADFAARAEDFQDLLNARDESPWGRCPNKTAGDGHVYVPPPNGGEADPPESYAVAADDWESVEATASMAAAALSGRDVAPE